MGRSQRCQAGPQTIYSVYLLKGNVNLIHTCFIILRVDAGGEGGGKVFCVLKWGEVFSMFNVAKLI